MNKEELTLLGFEIVAYSGEARSKFLEALNFAKEGNYERAEELVEEGGKSIVLAHNAQTNLLAQEASGTELPFSITLIHGQDHLMTAVLLQDLMKHMIEIYKRGNQ